VAEYDCDQVLSELEAFLDGELAVGQAREIEVHLSGCGPCFARGEFRRRLREIVRAKCSPAAEPPADLVVRIRRSLDFG
jgi:anti-sigma factor (TIGR02949 family)